jgi:hypothetical protein
MSPNKVEVWKQHLVVGVDGSPSSLAALHWAKIHAPELGFRIELITTWERAYAATDLAGTGMPMTLESEGFDPEKAASEILTNSTRKIFDHHRPIDLVTKKLWLEWMVPPPQLAPFDGLANMLNN